MTSAPAGMTWPIDGRAAVKAAIGAATRQAVAAAFGDSVRALVLTGSVARDEHTVALAPEAARLLGDAEFLVVIRDGRPRPPAQEVERAAAAAEHRLANSGVAAQVSLAACPPAFLRQLAPAIFAYELRACGQVIQGDHGVLGLVPSFPAAAIPREDAWRLLCNRLIEHLDGAGLDQTTEGRLSADAHYRTVKLYLDLATSLLVFVGAYESHYAARAARLRELAVQSGWRAGVPFPLSGLLARVEACTRFKLSGQRPPRADVAFRAEAIAWAERLWRWELSELTGLPASEPVPRLLQEWMARQPVHARLRGWLQVARAQGWLSGWRDRARWPRLFWRASPRYWVYAAAAALVFDGQDAGASGSHASWRGRLPVLPPAGAPEAGGATAAHRLAAAVSWNYRRYLVHTRS
jgi:hypothetical protein